MYYKTEKRLCPADAKKPFVEDYPYTAVPSGKENKDKFDYNSCDFSLS